MGLKMFKQTTALGVISFLSGFALMAYELVAARLLAPTIGSSIYVWTSVIGVIIAALSVGYWLGGKLADARQRQIDVVLLSLASAAGVVLTMLTYAPFLDWVTTAISDVRVQGVVASLVLFAPTSFLLGMKSPYLAKLNIKTLKTAGESVANLSALNSVGGIIGTFTTGFILFGYLGSRETLVIVVAMLILSSWLLVPRAFIIERVIASIVLLLLSLIPVQTAASTIAQIDTPSAHYEISSLRYVSTPIVGLQTGPGGIQSGVRADGDDELVFWYTRYAEAIIQTYKPDRVLILGGGAFTLPESLAQKLPDATIDVVEIDPELENISKDYFHYQDQPNVNLIFSDARSFVNTTQNKYDVIFVDVYGDSYVPFSLLTREYGAEMNRILTTNGNVIVNAITGTGPYCQQLLSAISAVYSPYLKNAYWNTETGFERKRGNYILVYTNQTGPLADLKPLTVQHSGASYTDNFMPAERLHYGCREESLTRSAFWS